MAHSSMNAADWKAQETQDLPLFYFDTETSGGALVVANSTTHESQQAHESIVRTKDERNQDFNKDFSNRRSSTATMLPPQERWSHVSGTDVGENDLILGRGIGKSHHGNLKFRALIRQHKYRYISAPKTQKPRVAEDVVKIWRQMDPPGRFLAKKARDTKDDEGPTALDIRKEDWYDVGDRRAREKASMSLREKTPDVMPWLHLIKDRQEQEASQRTSHALRTLEREQQPQQQWGYSSYQPSAAAGEPLRAPSSYMLPPPPPPPPLGRSTTANHPPPPLPPPPSRILPPVPAWRDYRPKMDRELSPLRGNSGTAADTLPSPASRSPNTLFQAQQTSEIIMLRKQVDEKNQIIQLLEQQVETLKAKDKATETPKRNVTPAPLPAAGGNLLSPVPFSGTNDENNEALEGYGGMLMELDCFHEDAENRSFPQRTTGPLQPRSIATPDPNKPPPPPPTLEFRGALKEATPTRLQPRSLGSATKNSLLKETILSPDVGGLKTPFSSKNDDAGLTADDSTKSPRRPLEAPSTKANLPPVPVGPLAMGRGVKRTKSGTTKSPSRKESPNKTAESDTTTPLLPTNTAQV